LAEAADGPVSVRLLAFDGHERSGAHAGRPLRRRALGARTAIALDSPEAATLFALCKKTAGNPLALDAWMAELVPAASGESSAVTP
jgi:hypothetical protein